MAKLKINKYLFFIAAIIFFNLQGFYLVDTSNIPTSDIAILLEVAFMIYVYIKCRQRDKGRYSFVFIVPLILVISSTYTAYINYGQPFYLGIRAQRHWLMAMLMYFPLSQLIRSDKLCIDGILNLLDKIIIIYSTLVVLQYFLGSSFMFMHVQNSMRYNSIRLYVSTYFLLISYFYHLKRLIDGKKMKAIDLLITAVTLFIHLFVTKSRMGLVILVGVTIYAILSMRVTGRKLVFICLVIFSGCVFMSTSMGQTMLDSIFGSSSSDSGIAIRDVGRVFYIEKTMNSPLTTVFGSGFANLDWGPTVTGTRYLEGIYYNDNGIIGLIYYYGFAFVLWMIFSHIKIMRDAWKNGSKDMFFYLLCGLLGIYTLFPYCYVTDISFALVCAIVDKSANVRLKEKNDG